MTRFLSGWRALPGWVVFLCGMLLALPFILTLALEGTLSHDEHQHIAAGVLFARDGLLPYRDFPYFHVPDLVYVYGLLFRLTDHYVLASRLFSAGCAALMCGTLALFAWRTFPRHTTVQRLAIAAGAIGLLLAAPVFSGTVGHSWNQEPSVLLVLLAFLCHQLPPGEPRPARRLFVSGLLLGLAIGTRVTFAPLVLPFALMVWFSGVPMRERWRLLLALAGGCALALVPVVCAAISAPQGFWFGNGEFPKLNIEYRMATGEPRTMTLATKLRFLFKLVMRPNWALGYGFLTVWAVAWLRSPFGPRSWPRLFHHLLLTLPFLLLGALAPSPVFEHYFYPLAPFLILGMLALLSGLPAGLARIRWLWAAGGAVTLLSVALGMHKYAGYLNLLHPPQWNVTKVRDEARELRRLVPEGRVLTPAGTLAVEAGLPIYPEFAPGPFAWRVAPFVPRARRAGLHVLAPDDLEARLAADPPAAILLGFEKRWEDPLAAYARDHGYRLIPFARSRDLWLPPAADPQPGALGNGAD